MRPVDSERDKEVLCILRVIGSLLCGQPGAMAAWQVQAFFLGVLASGNMRLRPEHLLSRILGDDIPQSASGEDAEGLLDAMALLAALEALWRRLAERGEQGVRLSPFQVPDLPGSEHVRAFAERRVEELSWFIRGMNAGGPESAERDAATRELLRSLSEASRHFRYYIEKPVGMVAQDRARARRDSAAILVALTWAAELIIGDLLDLGRKARPRAAASLDEVSGPE